MVKEFERLNAYLSPKVKQQLTVFAEEHKLSVSASANLILEQFFEGKEMLSSFGTLQNFLENATRKFLSEQMQNESSQSQESNREAGDSFLS